MVLCCESWRERNFAVIAFPSALFEFLKPFVSRVISSDLWISSCFPLDSHNCLLSSAAKRVVVVETVGKIRDGPMTNHPGLQLFSRRFTALAGCAADFRRNSKHANIEMPRDQETNFGSLPSGHGSENLPDDH